MHCIKARADLSDHLSASDSSNSAIWLAVSGCIEANNENFSPLITQQITHIANCRSCQKWLDFIDPSRIIARKLEKKYSVLKCKEQWMVIMEQRFRLRCSEMKIPVGALTTTTPSHGSVHGAVRCCPLGHFSHSLRQEPVANLRLP